MTSGPSGWLPVGIASGTSLLAGGSAGALISTYGGKGRERRKIRSKAMTALLELETKRHSQPMGDRLKNADAEGIANLQARCMLAGVPYQLVELYATADKRWRHVPLPKTSPPDFANDPQPWLEIMLAGEVLNHAARLLRQALWHPWLSKPTRRWRARKLKSTLDLVFGIDYDLESSLTRLRSFWRQATGKRTRRGNFYIWIREILFHPRIAITGINAPPQSDGFDGTAQPDQTVNGENG